MKLERTKNAKRNIRIGMGSQIVSYIFRFLVKSVLFRTLGAEYLGLNSLCYSILQVLNLVELGVGNAIIFHMYKPVAEDDTKTINALLRYYKIIYQIIGTIIMILGIMAIPFLPYFAKDNYPQNINVYFVYLIWLANSVLSYFMFAYKSSLLEAYQRRDIITFRDIFTQIIEAVVQMTALYLWRNYYAYCIVAVLCSILRNVITVVVVRKKYPQYVCEGKLESTFIADLGKKVSGLMFGRISNTLRNTFDVIFVSSFMGLTMAAMYGNYYYTVNALFSFPTVLTRSVQAGIGNSIVKETEEKNYDDFGRINFIYMWFCGWCTVGLVVFLQPFMEWWMGGEMVFDNTVFIMFCVYFYIMGMENIRETYANAAGLWWEEKVYILAELACNLFLNIVMGILMGVFGILLATIFSMLLFHVIMKAKVLFLYFFKKESVCQYLGGQFIHLAVTVVACFSTYVCACAFDACRPYAIKLLLQFLTVCIIPNLVYLLVYYRTNRFQKAWKWIRGAIRI